MHKWFTASSGILSVKWPKSLTIIFWTRSKSQTSSGGASPKRMVEPKNLCPLISSYCFRTTSVRLSRFSRNWNEEPGLLPKGKLAGYLAAGTPLLGQYRVCLPSMRA